MEREYLVMLEDQFKIRSEMIARQCLRTEGEAYEEECQNYLHELWAEDIPEEEYLNFHFRPQTYNEIMNALGMAYSFGYKAGKEGKEYNATGARGETFYKMKAKLEYAHYLRKSKNI